MEYHQNNNVESENSTLNSVYNEVTFNKKIGYNEGKPLH